MGNHSFSICAYLRFSGIVFSKVTIIDSMLISVEILSVIIILLIIFFKRNQNRHIKFKRFGIAILIWFLIQALLVGIGITFLVFVPAIEESPSFKGEDGLSTYAAIILWPTIFISTVSAVYFSQRILKRK